MSRTLILAVSFSISFGLLSFKETRAVKKESLGCQYWQSKVDAQVQPPTAALEVDLTDQQTILDAIMPLFFMSTYGQTSDQGCICPNSAAMISKCFKR